MSDSKVWGLNPQRGLWYCAILSKRPFEIPILIRTKAQRVTYSLHESVVVREWAAMRQQFHWVNASNKTAIWSYLLVRFPQ